MESQIKTSGSYSDGLEIFDANDFSDQAISCRNQASCATHTICIKSRINVSCECASGWAGDPYIECHALDPKPTPGDGNTNSVNKIVEDMSEVSSYPIAILLNGRIQEVPDGQYPSKWANVTMGNLAHGEASPTWWDPSRGYEYIRDVAWGDVLPWIVILTGTENKASNTRIEMRNIKSYYLSKSSGQWIKLGEGKIDGFNCPPGQWDNCGGSTDIKTLADGSRSLQPSGTGSNFHGWGGDGYISDPYDVVILHTTLQARLVGSDIPLAQYMLQVGTDYYPPGLSVNEMGGYNPGSGYSRSYALAKEWVSVSYTTIDDARIIHNPNVAADTNLLIQNPPPLD